MARLNKEIAELERGMTPRQIELARSLAKDGIPKVEAYRRVYGYKGRSSNGLQVAATRAAQNAKVSLLASVIRDSENALWWKDKKKLQEHIVSGILDTAANTESDMTRLKALELAGRTRFASVFEEPQANEANTATGDAIVSLIGARLQSLLTLGAPNLGNQLPETTVDADFDPIPSETDGDTPTPTGGGEGV
jgi:hypothetical protein